MTTTPPTPSAPAATPVISAPLPGLLGELVRCLDDRLAVPAPVGSALVIQALSAALGPSARLVDDPAPSLPVELNTFVLAAAGSTLPLAWQALLAPLLALQDALWSLAGEQPTSHPDPVEDQARERPLVLLNAPSFEELQAAGGRSFDGSLFVVHDAGSWERFWPDVQAPNNGSRLRLLLRLLAGQAKVTKPGVPRREIITLLVEVRPDAPAWQEFVTHLPADLCSRVLVVDAGPRPTHWPIAPTLPEDLINRWAELVKRVFAQRGRPAALVSVSPGARRHFHQFHRELLARAPGWAASVQDQVFGWPVMARRIALVLQQAGEDASQPLQPAHALAGIALARGYGGAMLGLREAAERKLREAGQLADRQRLIASFKKLGETDFRSVYRCMSDQSPARWAPVLDGLLADGIVLELPNGKFSLAEHQLHRLHLV